MLSTTTDKISFKAVNNSKLKRVQLDQIEGGGGRMGGGGVGRGIGGGMGRVLRLWENWGPAPDDRLPETQSVACEWKCVMVNRRLMLAQHRLLGQFL